MTALGDPQQQQRAIDLVAPHCDLLERLDCAPPSARVRGVFFRKLDKQLERFGKLEAYRAYFPDDSRAEHDLYYIGDYLVRLACAGAVVASPERLHEGMFLLGKDNAQAYIQSLIGKVTLRKLAEDPVRLMEQGLAARRQSFTYGRWQMRLEAERCMLVEHRDEFVWIESEIAGAARGTFEPLGITDVETKLVDRFDGVTTIRW